MYQGFYSLKENPFRLSPDPGYMCMTAQHQEALSGLIYSACTRPGLTVLVGEAGTGKTTLLYSLLALLEKRRYITAMCTNPTLTRDEFYDFLIIKFGVKCDTSLKSGRLAALEETLQRNRAEGRPSVLIVDEAQRLPTELLEEIRLLLNLETPTEKLLEIIISGQPELADMLARSELRQLKQRVSCVCRLRPLTIEELREYLYYRLGRAGLTEQMIFSEAIIQLIYQYTQGIPRLINSLCDSALQTGFALQSPRITRAILDEAAKDLDLVYPAIPDGRAVNGHAATPAAPVDAPTVTAVNGTAGSHKNGSGTTGTRVPFEDFGQPKRLGLFSNFMNRWR